MIPIFFGKAISKSREPARRENPRLLHHQSIVSSFSFSVRFGKRRLPLSK